MARDMPTHLTQKYIHYFGATGIGAISGLDVVKIRIANVIFEFTIISFIKFSLYYLLKRHQQYCQDRRYALRPSLACF